MGLLKEFRDFAMKGNVVDMAVGVIIGAAFGKIVNSLVKDIMMPVLGSLGGKGSFGQEFIYLGRDVDKCSTLGNVKPQFLPITLHAKSSYVSRLARASE